MLIRLNIKTQLHRWPYPRWTLILHGRGESHGPCILMIQWILKTTLILTWSNHWMHAFMSPLVEDYGHATQFGAPLPLTTTRHTANYLHWRLKIRVAKPRLNEPWCLIIYGCMVIGLVP